ncbi:MAG: FAD-binding oxidoreductase, partial [Candidatus Heimdallarchaeota archaeon]|nr:FAD-binding oxidoreductase [Candidatus Heimdallarchaeota archaeon]
MENSWDYIIVGAGVLGTATASYLKGREPEKNILLVDKYSTAGQGNTGKSNACYRNIFDTALNVMICTASIEYYRQMEKEGIDLGIEEFGYLWLLSDEQYYARNEKNIKYDERLISLIEFMGENKIKIEMFEKNRILEMLPHLIGSFDGEMEYGFGEDIKYGFMGRECGGMAPDLLVKHYESEFREKGGECSYGTEVLELLIKEKGIEYDPDYINTVWRDAELAGIRVKKGDGVVSIMADKIILTTGAWINQLLDPLGINSTIKAKKRQLFRICDLPDFVQNPSFSDIQSIPFLILPTGGVFIKPVPG